MTDHPNFRVTVEILCRREDSFLLMKRSPDEVVAPGAWHVPAGKAEYDEIPVEAAVRELREETGLVLLPEEFRQIGCRASSFPVGDEQAYRLIFTYAADIEAEKEVVLNEEHTEYRWLTRQEMDDPAYESMRPRIKAQAEALL